MNVWDQIAIALIVIQLDLWLSWAVRQGTIAQAEKAEAAALKERRREAVWCGEWLAEKVEQRHADWLRTRASGGTE